MDGKPNKKLRPLGKKMHTIPLRFYKSDAMRIVLIGMHATAELETHTANGFINVPSN